MVVTPTARSRKTASAATVADGPAPNAMTCRADWIERTASSNAGSSTAPPSAVSASVPARMDVSSTAADVASAASTSGGAKNRVVPRARAISILSSVNPVNPMARAARTTLGGETPARAATCAVVLAPTNKGSASSRATTFASLAARSPQRAWMLPIHCPSRASSEETPLPTSSFIWNILHLSSEAANRRASRRALQQSHRSPVA